MTNWGLSAQNSAMKINIETLWLVIVLSTGSPMLAAVPMLSDTLSEQVSVLSDQADLLLEQGHFLEAAEQYQRALDLLPKPLSQWQACTWLTVSVGDSYYFAGDYQAAQKALLLAMDCPDANWNAYARLRMGQVQLELGNCERAADELIFALAIAGFEIFEGEPPKYLDFAASFLSLQQASNGALQC